MNDRILVFLKKLLGHYKLLNNNEVAFHCPFCIDGDKEKFKFQVSLSSHKYHCWRCEVSKGTKGNNLFTLLKQLNASREDFVELREILREYKGVQDVSAQKLFLQQTQQSKTEYAEKKRLPDEFIPLYLEDSKQQEEYNIAMNYLIDRGIDFIDLIKYNIGFCNKGKYKSRIIIPSYDLAYELNYFIARSYEDEPYRKYQNPSWNKSDIIFFESHINWKYNYVILVEGVFDALAIKINAIPILGKKLSPTLIKKLILNNVKNIYLCLDRDAIRDSVDQAYLLNANGINVKLMILSDGKDPSEIGFTKMQEKIENNEYRELSYTDLINIRLGKEFC